MVDISIYKKPQDRKKLIYPNIPSSIEPVQHDEHMPIPVPPTSENADDADLEKSDRDEEWEELDEALPSGEPYFPN